MKFLFYLCFVFGGVSIVLCRHMKKLQANSPCTNPNNEAGVCTQFDDCAEAKISVDKYRYHNFTTCTFNDLIEVVCCPMFTPSRFPKLRISEQVCNNYTKDFSNTNVVFPTIFGGQNATPGQFPFMAALGLYSEKYKIYKFSCGGTIISEKYIITAAHCLENRDEDKVKIVRLGVINVPESVSEIDPRNDFKVKEYKVHPNYTRRVERNDIGLIELEDPLQFREDLRPACLFTNDTNYPQEFVIMGWGGIDTNTKKAEILQRANVFRVTHEDCSRKYAKYNRPLFSTQVCASHNMSDTCLGDSGGPLVMRRSDFPVLIGVTSFGLPGCGPGNPSIYTSISQYLDWIESNVWTNIP